MEFSLDSRRLVALTALQLRQWDVSNGTARPHPPRTGSPDDLFAGFQEVVGRAVVGGQDVSVSPPLGLYAHLSPQGDAVVLWPLASCSAPDRLGRRRVPESAPPVARLEGHIGPVLCVEFSPDGTRLATGGRDRTIRIWDTRTWEQLLVLDGHEHYVKDLAFRPDGSLLASASGDFTVRLWDTRPLHVRAVGRNEYRPR